MVFVLDIDTLLDKDNLIKDDLKHLIPMYEEFRNQNHFTILYKEFTRFQSTAEPSLIDHILTNCPEYLDNVLTKSGLISDHKMIVAYYHINEIIDQPKYAFELSGLI